MEQNNNFPIHPTRSLSETAWKYVELNSMGWLGLKDKTITRNVRKRTFGRVRPPRIQIRLRIRAVWSEPSLGTFWRSNDAQFLHADNEDLSDYTDAQADLGVRCAHISDGTVSHNAARMSWGFDTHK